MRKILIYCGVFISILIFSFSYVVWGVEVSQEHVIKTERVNAQELPLLLNESSLFETSWNWCCMARRFKELKPGEYRIQKGMSTWDLVAFLRQGDPSSILIRTDETRSLIGFCESLSGQLQFSKEAYLIAFCNAMGADTSSSGIAKSTSILFADTYDFQFSESPQSIAERFKKIHGEFWNQDRTQKAEALGLSPFEVYILASIVKGECRHMEEAGTIARLYLNRLSEKMMLQCDATVQFIVERENAQRILNEDLNRDSPYNTYKVLGLPPGPIYIVEKEYLDAVLNAPLHRYIYMCAKSDGSGWHLFTAHFPEHSRNASAYRKYMDQLEIKK